MLSTPAPIPTSIMPALIALAISTQACSPELHCRLTDLTAVVAGKPATNAAARNSVAPPPGGKTEPTAMSSTRAGSICERTRRALNAPTSRSAAGVSLKPPLPPLVKGVRNAAVMTICASKANEPRQQASTRISREMPDHLCLGCFRIHRGRGGPLAYIVRMFLQQLLSATLGGRKVTGHLGESLLSYRLRHMSDQLMSSFLASGQCAGR